MKKAWKLSDRFGAGGVSQRPAEFDLWSVYFCVIWPRSAKWQWHQTIISFQTEYSVFLALIATFFVEQ